MATTLQWQMLSPLCYIGRCYASNCGRCYCQFMMLYMWNMVGHQGRCIASMLSKVAYVIAMVADGPQKKIKLNKCTLRWPFHLPMLNITPSGGHSICHYSNNICHFAQHRGYTSTSVTYHLPHIQHHKLAVTSATIQGIASAYISQW